MPDSIARPARAGRGSNLHELIVRVDRHGDRKSQRRGVGMARTDASLGGVAGWDRTGDDLPPRVDSGALLPPWSAGDPRRVRRSRARRRSLPFSGPHHRALGDRRDRQYRGCRHRHPLRWARRALLDVGDGGLRYGSQVHRVHPRDEVSNHPPRWFCCWRSDVLHRAWVGFEVETARHRLRVFCRHLLVWLGKRRAVVHRCRPVPAGSRCAHVGHRSDPQHVGGGGSAG